MKYQCQTCSKTYEGLCFVSGIKAAMKTPTATFSGYLSMASAIFNPPRLCPTSTTFSFGGREAKNSNKGSVYSYMVWTSWIAFLLMPEAARSRAVTRWPADSSRGLSLYQLQAPWHAPCTRTKCFCTLGAAIFSVGNAVFFFLLSFFNKGNDVLRRYYI